MSVLLRRFVLCTLLSLSLISGLSVYALSPAHAQTPMAEKASLQAGIDAFESEDYVTAFKHFLPLAVNGSAESQYRIGLMYFQALGLPQDECLSTLWMEKAARQGHPYAAISMSYSFNAGWGVRKNKEMAYRWMVYADNVGHPKAAEDIDFMARGLSEQERAQIDEDMKSWDPAHLPQPEFFLFDRDIVPGPEFSNMYRGKLGLEACR